MSDSAETLEQQDHARPSDGERQVLRRRVAVFVVSFLVLVVALLTGYRYSLNTLPNVWYLYQVAVDTSFVLDVLGRSCRVESEGYQKGRENWVRNEIKRITGREVPQDYVRGSVQEGPPLSSWEIWRYRSLRLLESGQSLENQGPLVHFAAAEGKLFTFRLVPDCGAVPSMAIFVAAVLAFPVAIWKRLAGVLLGIPILYGINIVRLTSLSFVGAYYGTGEVFEFSHEVVWQSVFVVFVVAVWLLWVEFLVRRTA